MASMRFCRVCNNMLYPKEDKESRRLMFACRNCTHEQKADVACVFRHELVKTARAELDNIPKDVVQDPTLQRRKDVECDNCREMEAVFFQAKENPDSKRMALIFVCCSCNHRWEG